MYIGVDIGATKTLLGLFNSAGRLLKTHKFKTPQRQTAFLDKLIPSLDGFIDTPPRAIAVAAPGLTSGTTLVHGGRLKWFNLDFKAELRQFNTPVIVENDALLGALTESRTGNGQKYPCVLYLTLSTSVGTGIVINQKIQPGFRLSEGGHMLLPKDCPPIALQSTVSGPAFKRRFGKFGYEVSDPNVWHDYSQDLAAGIFNMVALICPDVVVIGGGMSVHFDKFIKPLKKKLMELAKDNHVITIPPLKQAAYPETASIYGCYELAKEL